MQITVHCGCGKPFRFEEEPVGGRVKFPVSCPNCGADVTDKANAFIDATLRGESPKASKPKGFSLFGRGKAQEDDFESKDARSDATAGPGDKPKKVNLLLGAAGALAVGVACMFGWFYLAKATGFEFGIVAWAIGGLVGLGARLFVPQGSFGLAGVAGLSAFVAILGGQYLVFKHHFDRMINIAITTTYDQTLDYAKLAVKEMNDDDTREFLARTNYKLKDSLSNDKDALAASRTEHRFMASMEVALFGLISGGEKRATFKDLIQSSDPDSITAADLAEFRQKEVPELKAFVDGKPPRAAFEASLRQLVDSRISTHDMITQSINPYTILWLVLGIATAYKIAYNASEVVSD